MYSSTICERAFAYRASSEDWAVAVVDSCDEQGDRDDKVGGAVHQDSDHCVGVTLGRSNGTSILVPSINSTTSDPLAEMDWTTPAGWAEDDVDVHADGRPVARLDGDLLRGVVDLLREVGTPCSERPS